MAADITPARQVPLTISDAAEALREGDITSVALTEALISRADRLDSEIGCYLARTSDQALAAAAAADAALASGDPVSLLTGIPLGIKDIIATRDAGTTAQSLVLDPGFGAQGDAPAVARLRAAGSVIMGKTTTMEYAFGCPDPEMPFPVPRNPWDLTRWTGGSSSGSANGVAAGLMLGGLGTDTAGSVRLPAGWCGVSGLKPTFGRVPKSGCVPLGYSYDTVGPMARSARDCAIMLAVLAGHDGSDACSADVAVDDYLAALDGEISGLRVGVVTSLAEGPGVDSGIAACFHAAVAALASAGVRLRQVELPYFAEAQTATMMGLTAEALAYHRADLQCRWADYGASTRISIAAAAMTTAADYVQAQRVRRAAVRAVAELFATVDVVLAPCTAVVAPRLDAVNAAELVPAFNTPYWNAVGNPVIAVPMGLTPSGLPAGLQIAGRPFDEATALKVADGYQTLTAHHLAVPPLAAEEPIRCTG